jgi:Aspartyl protease
MLIIYRNHPMRFTRRVMLISAATAVLSGCTTTQHTSLQEVLSQEGYIAVPMRKLATGHETISVVLNGKEGLFVLDSGAGASVVHTDYAMRFGLNVASGLSKDGTGAGGKIQLQNYPVSLFLLSGTTLPVKSIYLTSIKPVVDALKNAAGIDIHGIIGQDILTTFSGIIDIRSQVLYLRIVPAKASPA